MRTFHLWRHEDASGVSGVGRVAEGVQFSDGRCAVRWMSQPASLSTYDCIEHVVAIHGHGGCTEIVWENDELDQLRSMSLPSVHTTSNG